MSPINPIDDIRRSAARTSISSRPSWAANPAAKSKVGEISSNSTFLNGGENDLANENFQAQNPPQSTQSGISGGSRGYLAMPGPLFDRSGGRPETPRPNVAWPSVHFKDEAEAMEKDQDVTPLAGVRPPQILPSTPTTNQLKGT